MTSPQWGYALSETCPVWRAWLKNDMRRAGFSFVRLHCTRWTPEHSRFVRAVVLAGMDVELVIDVLCFETLGVHRTIEAVTRAAEFRDGLADVRQHQHHVRVFLGEQIDRVMSFDRHMTQVCVAWNAYAMVLVQDGWRVGLGSVCSGSWTYLNALLTRTRLRADILSHVTMQVSGHVRSTCEQSLACGLEVLRSFREGIPITLEPVLEFSDTSDDALILGGLAELKSLYNGCGVERVSWRFTGDIARQRELLMELFTPATN
jgi:hypothetical protein